MKELIRFSLTRRFNNKATKLFNIIIFVIIGCGFFADGIITFINPDFYKKDIIYVLNMNEEMRNYLNIQNQDVYEFSVLNKSKQEVIDQNDYVLEVKKEQYIVHSKYEVSPPTLHFLSAQLTQYHKDRLIEKTDNMELFETYNKVIHVDNKSITKNKVSADKNNLIFMFVTSVYFMMLSFISGVASEVVNEKATKTLELILTSVSAKTHFYSKLIVGWLMIMIQFLLNASYLLFWFLLRSIYDQGSDLIVLIKKMNIIEVNGNNFYAILSNFDFSFAFFEKVLYIIVFLLLGILLAQLILVIISSFVSSVEEASNIQAPFYLLLLAIYYLVIAINNPYELSEGIGYYLSFVPFINMLVMPCRILIEEVPFFQMCVSAGISILLVYMICKKGSKVYERGVLDYSCKGFIAILKSIYKRQ